MRKLLLILALTLAVMAVASIASADVSDWQLRLVGGLATLGATKGEYEFVLTSAKPEPGDWRWAVKELTAALANYEISSLQMSRCEPGICGVAKIRFPQ